MEEEEEKEGRGVRQEGEEGGEEEKEGNEWSPLRNQVGGAEKPTC